MEAYSRLEFGEMLPFHQSYQIFFLPNFPAKHYQKLYKVKGMQFMCILGKYLAINCITLSRILDVFPSYISV